MTGMTGSPAPEDQPEEQTPPPPPMAPPSTAVEDLGEIAPPPGDPFPIGAESPEGAVLVRVNRLRTIELLMLLRALSAGVGPALAEVDFTDDTDENVGLMVGLIITGMGEAGPQVMDFLRAVVKPVGKDDKARVSKEMVNPDIEDTLEIVERIVAQEMPDFERLLGKAQTMFERMQTTYRRTRTPAG